MKLFTSVALLFSFASGSLAYYNCNLPVGGAYGTCTGNGGDRGYFACNSAFPCRVQGNGCYPLGSGVANCS
ncbi:hypothetical protein EJ02DRAFT_449567 [Clathrospora elynae]|uniref:Uncharacterized protein n=1 Tax=Clathrospora elynae TaxID=706981 RepID=A0A6A5TER3_9PLEO|nr:hypothetical protein EJ02DRAFT_449567 [Clathrospora elynae]